MIDPQKIKNMRNRNKFHSRICDITQRFSCGPLFLLMDSLTVSWQLSSCQTEF